jgi:hypothetical protein
MRPSALFVSNAGYLSSEIQGGVQLCTGEYIRYIGLAGFDVKEYPIHPSFGFVQRLKIKLKLDAYDHYDIGPFAGDLVKTINSQNIKVVFLNQITLSPWAGVLKTSVAGDVKFIGLSHGNESGDYLNDITVASRPAFLQTWKLGKLLAKENYFFSKLLDGVIVLSEQEIAINQWLGAKNLLYLPRLLAPANIDWQPVQGRAGFAGTLDHLPNYYGITWLAGELKKQNFRGKLRLVGGPEHVGKKFAQDFSFIEYIGPVNDQQLVTEAATWSVFLNPVFWYARGSSTKLAQAINWGLPCLSTPAGRRGYSLSKNAIITADDTPATFAAALIALISDHEKIIALKRASEANAASFDPQPYVSALGAFIKKVAGISS